MVNPEFDRNKLTQMGIHRGGKSWKWNPSMSPFVYKKKWKTYFFDLEKIIQRCQGIDSYINSLIQEKKVILFLGTKNSVCETMKEEAVRCGMPYVVSKWKGGFLTNFEQVKKKIEELRRTNKFILSQSFQNLPEKKKSEVEKKRDKLKNVYEGVINLNAIPNALFIIGLQKEKVALRETKNENINIPVIAVCNTDCNSKWVDYVLPGNDQEDKAVKFFAGLVADAIIKAKEKQSSEGQVAKEEMAEVKTE